MTALYVFTDKELVNELVNRKLLEKNDILYSIDSNQFADNEGYSPTEFGGKSSDWTPINDRLQHLADLIDC